MCTRVTWTAPGYPVITGRNMDWLQDLGTNLWVLPRGLERVGMPEGDPNPARWTARYGSVVATGHDFGTADGLNEAGLGVHMLWLADSDYGADDATRPGLSVSMWAQYFLDRFATVRSAVEAIERDRLHVVTRIEPNSGKALTVHLAMEDAAGDSAIVEYVGGQAYIHHGPEHTVMTNSPPYDQQLELLKRYQGFGGTLPLPGTTEAEDRFVRASYYSQRLPQPASVAEAYAAVLSVMRNVAQPFGIPDPERPNISATIWRTLCDHESLIYAFESSYSPDIVWVHLTAVDFTRPARLDLKAEGLVGDVTSRFEPRDEAFAFLLSEPRRSV